MTTYDELWEYVENDTKEHEIKKIAELFLSAMLDWPKGYENVSFYVNDFKEYFGSPLSIGIITSKKFDLKNSWQLVSGSSIVDMIEVSKLYLGEERFDEIIQIIFAYYKK